MDNLNLTIDNKISNLEDKISSIDNTDKFAVFESDALNPIKA